jgi:hypothetical protein
VFRRDVANSPPDRIAVRVIAKIKQSLKFVMARLRRRG